MEIQSKNLKRATRKVGPTAKVSLALMAAAFLLSAGGDWPWALDNSADWRRCDPICAVGSYCVDGQCVCKTGYDGDNCEKCMDGYKGYPSCVLDPCYPEKCSSHGTCTEGVCSCDTGYTGSDCSKCENYYTGYPNCTKMNCDCTDGVSVSTCVDGISIKECKSCKWVTTACATYCSSRGQKSSGCGADPGNGNQFCYCADAGKDIMLIKLSDVCMDGKSVQATVYDKTSNGHFGEKVINNGGSEIWKISCTTGNQICFGAWNDSYFWGCGKNCQQTSCISSGACCDVCGSKLILTFSLKC